jgi:hypothetical protein
MGIVNTGEEGIKTLLFGNVIFTLDSVWSDYTSAFNREYSLTNRGGYSVRRTEAMDKGGKLSGRGIDSPLYEIWVRKGKSSVPKPRGRKPRK